MLQNIGDTLKGQRWLAFLLLGLLILVFALWGAYGIVDLSFGTPSYALKVNGEEVPANQVQNAWQEQQSKYQEQLLDQYVRETLVRQRATERGFRVDDQAVVMAYQRESAFQVGGKFDATA